MLSETVEAADMAYAVGIDPKRFRHALRDAKLSWHEHEERWVVRRGSSQHKDMQSVLKSLICGTRNANRT